MISEPTIVAAISSLFGGRVSPDTAASTTTRPFCIYQQIGGVPINTFCGDMTEKGNATIQFWVWADTRNEANTLMRSLHSALTAAPIRATSQGGLQADYNDVTRSYGAVQRFSFWA